VSIRGTLLALVLAIAPVSAAHPCTFHGYTPDPTLVDLLLGAEDIIVAQPDPSTPGRLVIRDILLGQVGVAGVTADVDAPSGARLQADPDLSILLVRDVSYAPWSTVAVIDDRFRDIVDIIVENHEAWGQRYYPERFQMFAARLNDPAPEIRRLAYQELDRADYSVLRRLRLPPASLGAANLAAGDPDLAPIRVLLAGLSGERSHSSALASGLDAAIAAELPHLGAYATALIELLGPDGAAQITERYLGAETSLDVREKLVEALAIHSQAGAAQTQRAVRRALSDRLEQDPGLVGPIARQFGIRYDWSMLEPLSRALETRPSISVNDIFAVNQYIQIARQEEGGAQ